MLMIKERRPAIRTLRGWAISLLQEAGAIRECELHSWIQDRADPHARQRALALAEEDPPAGVSPTEAVAEIREVLDSIATRARSVPRRIEAGAQDEASLSRSQSLHENFNGR